MTIRPRRLSSFCLLCKGTLSLTPWNQQQTATKKTFLGFNCAKTTGSSEMFGTTCLLGFYGGLHHKDFLKKDTIEDSQRVRYLS